jgi:hypothetical protein
MAKKRERSTTIFEQKTTEGTWTKEGTDREYKIRYIHGEDCCLPGIKALPEWPKFRLPSALDYYYGDEEREANTDQEHFEDYDVLGGIWDSSGKLVAAWVYHDDSHVELFGKKDYEFIDDLETITGDLCETICPQMADVFDDGSGTEREVTKILDRLVVCEALDSLYLISDREADE